MSKTLTGLVTVNADDIYSDYYQDVSSQSIVYLNGLTSNVQQQIDTLSSKTNNGGGYFMIWAECANGYSTANSGYTWSYGANGTNATNTPLVLGFSCNLIRFSVRSSSIPTTAATIQILKNGNILYQVSGISSTAYSVDLSGSSLTFSPTDTISIATITGAGGGLIRVSLSFSSNGVQGPQGQGLTYRGTYSSSTYYNPYDFVYYNGSSYINILGCSGVVPTNATYWNLMAAQGQQGQKGDTGDRGPRGPQGDKGDTGDRGPKGDSGDIANIADVALAVIGTAGFAAIQTEVALLQTEMAAVQAELAIVDNNIADLQYKTAFQQNTGTATRFTSDVVINDGLVDRITLNTNGTIESYNIENAETVTTHTLQSTNIYNTQIIESNDINSTTVHSSSLLPNTNDLTQTISIGPVSQFGNVVINGYVTMPLMANFFGFNVNNGFINQF